MKICSKCGSQIPEKSLFCPICGSAVKDSEDIPKTEQIPYTAPAASVQNYAVPSFSMNVPPSDFKQPQSYGQFANQVPNQVPQHDTPNVLMNDSSNNLTIVKSLVILSAIAIIIVELIPYNFQFYDYGSYSSLLFSYLSINYYNLLIIIFSIVSIVGACSKKYIKVLVGGVVCFVITPSTLFYFVQNYLIYNIHLIDYFYNLIDYFDNTEQLILYIILEIASIILFISCLVYFSQYKKLNNIRSFNTIY